VRCSCAQDEGARAVRGDNYFRLFDNNIGRFNFIKKKLLGLAGSAAAHALQ
jgi:hypothetical protein